MIALRVLVSVGLILLPLIVFLRDWKFYDRRRKFNRRFSWTVALTWFVLALAVQAQKKDRELTALREGQEAFQHQNDKLQVQIAQYREEVGLQPFQSIAVHLSSRAR